MSPKLIAAAIWENKVAREVALLVVSAIAAQFVFSGAELVNAIDEAKDWSDLWASASAWGLAFSFAAVQTGIKQVVAWALSRAADRKLAGAASSSPAEIRREIINELDDRQLAALGLRRVAAPA